VLRAFYNLRLRPYGRFYSPIPNPANVTIAVGHPIPVEKTIEPSDEAVDKLHRLYFERLRELFNRHKSNVPGFEQSVIVYPELDGAHRNDS
jgi:hypothetical protein